jgi:hypothetical protein
MGVNHCCLEDAARGAFSAWEAHMKVAEELWLSVPEMLFLAARRRSKSPQKSWNTRCLTLCSLQFSFSLSGCSWGAKRSRQLRSRSNHLEFRGREAQVKAKLVRLGDWLQNHWLCPLRWDPKSTDSENRHVMVPLVPLAVAPKKGPCFLRIQALINVSHHRTIPQL